MGDDRLVADYRRWWIGHSPRQRRALQSLHGRAGGPQAAEVADLPGPAGTAGTWYLPDEVRRWDPDEGNPATRPIMEDDC